MSKSKTTSKPTIKKKDGKNIRNVVLILIAFFGIIIAFVYLGTPTSEVGGKKIHIIPELYNDGDSILDHGWGTYSLHADARWVTSDIGDTMHIRNDDWKTVDLRYYISTTSKLSLDFIIHYNNSYFSGEEIQLRFYSEGVLVYQFDFVEENLIAMNPVLHLFQIRVENNKVLIYPRMFHLDGSVNISANTITDSMKLDWLNDRSIPSGTVVNIDQIGFFVRHAAMNLYISNITGSYKILDTI